MAPVKQPKPPLKSMEKPVEKKIAKKKKKSYHSFSIYLYKVLRSVAEQENMGISRKSMLIMNNFVNDMFEKIAEEAAKLVKHTKKNTLTSKDIQFAINLLVPGELAKVANLEGAKAVAKYHQTKM
ncbi:histone H2B type 1-P-like [Battus philenor]|uniref:histone H2B type 1-P-like n=1 Tax=Battus philenor TaxID=42288 RepID=UPI0035D09F21